VASPRLAERGDAVDPAFADRPLLAMAPRATRAKYGEPRPQTRRQIVPPRTRDEKPCPRLASPRCSAAFETACGAGPYRRSAALR